MQDCVGCSTANVAGEWCIRGTQVVDHRSVTVRPFEPHFPPLPAGPGYIILCFQRSGARERDYPFVTRLAVEPSASLALARYICGLAADCPRHDPVGFPRQFTRFAIPPRDGMGLTSQSERSSLSPCIPGLPENVVAVPVIIAMSEAPSEGMPASSDAGGAACLRRCWRCHRTSRR